jgi:alanine-glyoxylate transaminase/serine-glyoxylate transaminase/serine-pyruvate transaminase
LRTYLIIDLNVISCSQWADGYSKDIVVAAGLHKDIKDKYFRVGHMGVSVVDTERGDLDKVIKGIKEAFAEAGYKST